MFKNFNLAKISYVFIPTITIIVVFLLVPFIFIPFWQKIGNLNKDIAEGNDRYNQMVSKEKKLKEISATEERGKLVKVTVALPSNKDIPSLIVGVKRMVQESGMSLESMQLNVGQVSASSTAMVMSGSSFDFKVTLKGSLEQLQGFLNKAQSAKRVFIVKSFDGTSGNTSDNLLTVTLSMSAPYESLPESMGDASLPLPQNNSALDKVFSKVEKLVNYTLPVNPSQTGKDNPFE
ncbi:MAG: type 4a pilus biogenesis protein PilO [Patescibacteria group bacterium]|nr:type 4a pilus biogenesis protein PilO [Patescibacteria group bacterium]